MISFRLSRSEVRSALTRIRERPWVRPRLRPSTVPFSVRSEVPEVIRTLRELHGILPMFGICLGHQLIALSFGARTYKLKFGHRGGNHPVKNNLTGRIEITSQNHSYAVDESSLSGTGLKVSHRNLLDGTIEGLCSDRERVFSVQFHPESAPGPQDSGCLFRQFTELMERR